MKEELHHVVPALKHGVDAIAAGVAWTAFFTETMPAVAVTLSVIWISLQIYLAIEKRWFKKVKND